MHTMHMPMLGHAHARLSLAPMSVPSHIYLEGAFSLDQPTRHESTPYLTHPVPPVGIVVWSRKVQHQTDNRLFLPGTVVAPPSPVRPCTTFCSHRACAQPAPPTTKTTSRSSNSSPVQLPPGLTPSPPICIPTTYSLQPPAHADRTVLQSIISARFLASLSSADRRPPSPRPPSALISLTPDSRVLALSQRRHSLPHGRSVAPRHFPLANRPRLVVWVGAGPLSSLRRPQRLLGRGIIDSSSTPPALIKPAPRPPLPTRPGPDTTATPSANHAGTAASKPPKAKTDGLPAPDPPASHRDHRTSSLDLPNKHRAGESLLAGHI